VVEEPTDEISDRTDSQGAAMQKTNGRKLSGRG
jgi:hypothetical protein